MKSTRSINLAVTIAVALSLALASPVLAQQRRASGQVGAGGGACIGGLGSLFDEIEVTSVSATESDELVYLREEEKLARDVYLTLAERWQLPIFSAIAAAEQRHTDAVKKALDLYEIADPVTDDTVGVFTNAALAQLFTDLVQQGTISLVDALIVGATIEDLDLNDLGDMLAIAVNDHVKLVGYNLAKGSRNHLRAFMRALTAQGGSCEPQYLDQETFDAILATEMERRVVYDANGDAIAVGGCGGRGGRGQRGGGQGGTGTCDGTGTGNSTGSPNQGGGQQGGTRDGSCAS